ncbi:MAG: hypothetical protein KGK11_03355, partial [Sphingomonadales bacterium]|nr:hypothetical protein [Sphingomonadales bacterium]
IIAAQTVAPGENALLAHHLAIEQAVIGGPLVAGETTKLLRNGPPTFDAIFAAIKGARRRIDMEYYIFQDVENHGEHIGDLLLAKRRQGVAISIIYDDFGSQVQPRAFFRRLAAAGIAVLKFNPLNPLDDRTGAWKPNDRDHRKILVVDGRLALVGGVNLATEYEINRFAKSGSPANATDLPWRDTDIEVTGPAVAQLEGIFVQHWREQRGPDLPLVLDPPPAAAPTGDSVVRFIASSPHHPVRRYYVTLVSALRAAERSITVEAAYFVPTRDETAALVAAAARGVDVALIVPSKTDSPVSQAVGRSHYGALLRAGVKIYERKGVILHSKTMTVDGVWSVVGSSNFDHRSIVYNDEVDAIVIGTSTAAGLEAMAAGDRARARVVTLADWRHRGFAERLKETFGKLVQNLL